MWTVRLICSAQYVYSKIYGPCGSYLAQRYIYIWLPSKTPLPTKTRDLSENTWNTFETETEAWKHAFPKLCNPRRSAKVPRRETRSWKRHPLSYSQNSAVREGPRSFREGKREGGNMNVKTLQSAKVPRSFREVKREGNFKSIMYVSVTFLE